ncbi:zinc finger protein GAI-ASSOCIATED FACTOR 1-like [Benincasa hispida]|uniref:zinc finger protein GAI-ASSOCIATED FACTOR 1-like n=1 Tax=Benincasa hispida TaxID=102211 RepID=UPI0018FFBAD4|nr:zinc finger protein GAI-ASSOCIATED FACTOR 1-like [Benincasa hispida]
MMSEFDGLSGLSTISNLIGQQHPNSNPNSLVPLKKKRNLPGTPDPDAEVIAMSPKSLMAKNRFICEICNKGFQRDQNLQLHRRGHNLPWKLRQRTSKEVRKKVYVCPEKSCVHHDPARALGDLTGIKKHYSRKHGEKKWKCEKCSKKYAVQSDWKAHSKICGTKEYKCDCGTLFSRKDSFITHRAFCDALAEENSRINHHPTFINNFSPTSSLLFQPNFAVVATATTAAAIAVDQTSLVHTFPNIISEHEGDHKPRPLPLSSPPQLPLWLDPPPNPNPFFSAATAIHSFSDNPTFLPENHHPFLSEPLTTASSYTAAPHMSATALLQKAAQMGPTRTPATPPILFNAAAATTGAVYGTSNSAVLSDVRPTTMKPLLGGAKEEIGGQNLTRDFLGVGNQVVHLMPVGSNQYSDQSRRH